MENSNSQTSLASASSNSSTASTETMRRNKRVSFGLQQTKYFAPPTASLNVQERKTICWYSDQELRVSRDEARRSIQALQQRLEEEEQKGNSSEEVPIDSLVITTTITCEDGGVQVVCLRGIEKYADAAAKHAGQKRHVGSVLHHHSLGTGSDQVAMIASTLSQPFKDVAYYYAIKSAEEQQALRKKEQEERHQVASAVLYLLAGGSKKEAPDATNLELPEDGRRTPPEMVSTDNNKRPRDTATCCGEEESSFCRNVKPCLRIITE